MERGDPRWRASSAAARSPSSWTGPCPGLRGREHRGRAHRLGAALHAVDGANRRAARLLLRHGCLPGLSRHRRRAAQCARVRDAGARRHARREPARPRRLAGESVSDVACVIVGGGPAGLAAARTAARHGVRVMLVDDNAALGGQYYRQMPPGSARPPARCSAASPTRAARSSTRCARSASSCASARPRGASSTGARWRSPPQERTERISAETLVLAPGAYDRPVPFPGWTLPGVITAGGAQNLMKGYGVLPGRRVLIAGSGPLLLVVAHYLIGGGARGGALRGRADARPLAPRAPHAAAPERRAAGLSLPPGDRGRGRAVPEGPHHPPGARRGEVIGAIISPCDGAWRRWSATRRASTWTRWWSAMASSPRSSSRGWPAASTSTLGRRRGAGCPCGRATWRARCPASSSRATARARRARRWRSRRGAWPASRWRIGSDASPAATTSASAARAADCCTWRASGG